MALRGSDFKPGEYMVAGNGVAWQLIESKTAHNSSRLDFITGIDASHDLLMAVLTNIVPAADADNFGVRMKSGGAFKSGANDYSYGNVRLLTPFEGNSATATQAPGWAAPASAISPRRGLTALFTSPVTMRRTVIARYGGGQPPREPSTMEIEARFSATTTTPPLPLTASGF